MVVIPRRWFAFEANPPSIVSAQFPLGAWKREDRSLPMLKTNVRPAWTGDKATRRQGDKATRRQSLEPMSTCGKGTTTRIVGNFCRVMFPPAASAD